MMEKEWKINKRPREMNEFRELKYWTSMYVQYGIPETKVGSICRIEF